MPPRAATADLAALAAGPPMLWVLDGVAADAPPADVAPGDAPPTDVTLWRVTWRDGAARLHRPGADPAAADRPLPAVPGQVLAIVARAAADAAPLLAWCAAAGAAPPLLEAASLAAAAGPLWRLTAAALAARTGEAADLQRALATLRAEAEATRAAHAALRRSLGHAAHPPAPTLALAGRPHAARRLAATPAGALRLGLTLGVPLDGIAGLELHVAEATPNPGTGLRIRLFGAESGRVVGAWRVPGDTLAPGWLALDLPAALDARRETACLDLEASVAPGIRLALSLEDAAAPAGAPCAVAAGVAEPDAALPDAAPGAPALRLWTAPPGGRPALALHWDPASLELTLPPPDAGVPLALPAAIWRGLVGHGAAAGLRQVAVGDGPAAARLELAGGAAALLRLPAVPLVGLDLLRARLAVPVGDAAALEAALWLLPPATVVDTLDALDPAVPGTLWSGWREGDPLTGGLDVPLALAPGAGPPAQVVLALRHRGPAGADPLTVEWVSLVGLRTRLAPAEAARPGRGPAVAGAWPAAATALGATHLLETYSMAEGRYRHLDLLLEGVRHGGDAWPRLRLKFALAEAAPQVELRELPDWPAMFQHFPGTATDAHGRLFVLDAPALAAGALRGVTARDRRLLLALFAVLPAAVATAARAAADGPADYARWVAAARALSAAAVAD